jgi:hypothetical protein
MPTSAAAVDTESPDRLPLVKVVGLSGSGKSTLVQGLRRAGYAARPVSQEHSSVPDLWRQFDRPAVLIHLGLNLAEQMRRRPDVVWTAEALAIEELRLAHAREHADLRIDTSALTAGQVLALALAYLRRRGLAHSPAPLPPLPATGSAERTAPPAAS